MQDLAFIINLKKELKTLLVDSIVDTILKLKESLPQHSAKADELLLLQSRLNDTNLKKLRGTVNEETLNLEYNRIREVLLTLIDDLAEQDFRVGKANASHKNGSLLYQVPAKMKVGLETKCIIRLAHDDAKIIQNIELTPETKISNIRISKIMHVDLIDHQAGENFLIRTYHEQEQFLETDDYTEWVFFVQALRDGYFPLVLKISIVEVIENKERLKNIIFEEQVLVSTEMVEQANPTDFKPANISLNYQTVTNQTLPTRRPAKQDRKRWLGVIAAMMLVLSVTFAFNYIIKMNKKAEEGLPASGQIKHSTNKLSKQYQEALEIFNAVDPKDEKTSSPDENTPLPEKAPPAIPPKPTTEVPTKNISEPSPSTIRESTIREKITTAPPIEKPVKPSVTSERLPTEEFALGWMIDHRDNEKYKIVRIKDKYWMAENLRFPTPESWCYQAATACATAGRLYSYRAAKVACPKGWRLPSDEEFKALASYLGGYSEKGHAIGKPEKTFQQLRAGGKTNFGGTMAGMRDVKAQYKAFGSLGVYWTSTLSSKGAAVNYFLSQQSMMLHRDNNASRKSGFSCRCVQE